MSEEDIEQAPRRRSARIIALEEKRERQKKALEEARKKCTEYKGKGKAVINGEEADYDLIDDEDDEEDDDEYAPTKKRGRKSRPLNQLISLTQPIQEGPYTEYSSISRRYGLPRMLPKDTLEFVLDLLQRQDPDEFFAQPVNPDKDYHKIVKEPMDFGTMRAKVHENMYTNMEQFKRDVYLICSNAMNVNPSSTSPHKVAEAINEEASKVFHALSADPEFFDTGYFGLDNKKSRGRKSHRRSKSSGRPKQLPSKPGGGNSGANNSMEAEVEKKRQTYCPPGGDSIFSKVLDGPKSNLQFHKPSCYYQDSLVRFVEGMGPTVKKFAARRIESLGRRQIMCGEATRPNPLANFLDTIEINTLGPTSTVPPRPPRPPPPPPPAAAAKLGRDAPHHGMHYPILSTRPLTIPGLTPQAPQETRNIDFDRTGDYKGKKVVVDSAENWDAYAASILSGYFMNNGGGRGRGRGLNLNGEGSSSGSNPASSFHQNRSSFLTMSSSFQEANQNQNQNQNQRMQWNDRPETSNARNSLVNTPVSTGTSATPSEFTLVRPRVWPSIVIPGPQAQSRPSNEPISNSDRQVTLRPTVIRPLCDYSLSGQPLLSRQNLMRREQELRLGHNLSELDFTLLRQALWSQQIPVEQVNTNNFTWQSFMPQNNKPAMFLNENNLSWQSFVPQQIPQEAMNMTSYNFSGQPLLSQQGRSNSNPINGYNLSGRQSLPPPQQRPEDVSLITGWQSFIPLSDFITWQSFMPQQKPQDHEQMAQALTGYNGNLSHGAKWTEEGTSNLYNMGNNNQPEDFQTIWAPIDLNNIPFTEHASIYTAPPALFGNSGDLLMQPEPKPELGQLNPLGLFPRQITPRPPSSSPSLEMPMGLNSTNYYVVNTMVGHQPVAGGGEGSSTAQLQWDDDHQPNLALQL